MDFRIGEKTKLPKSDNFFHQNILAANLSYHLISNWDKNDKTEYVVCFCIFEESRIVKNGYKAKYMTMIEEVKNPELGFGI